MKMLCFDMDGTIADLYGVDGWLDYLQKETSWPYLIAKPLCDMEALRDVLLKLKEQGWEIRIISWLSKDSSEAYKSAVRMAKIGWLCNYNFPLDACHLVAYGTTKADCVRHYHNKGDNFILVDDNKKVCDGWHLGDAINPQEVDIIQYLEKLVEI